MFYAVLEKRELILDRKGKDLSLQVEIIGLEIAFKERESKGYFNDLKANHISNFKNATSKNQIQRVFNFIEKHYL